MVDPVMRLPATWRDYAAGVFTARGLTADQRRRAVAWLEAHAGGLSQLDICRAAIVISAWQVMLEDIRQATDKAATRAELDAAALATASARHELLKMWGQWSTV